MMKTNRAAWGLAAILAALLLCGIGVLFGRLRLYWVARYHGDNADLDAAVLIFAPRPRADLMGANLKGATLDRADLSRANLTRTAASGACLHGANLTGADLSRADLNGADMRGANLHGADLGCSNLAWACSDGPSVPLI